MSAAPASDNLPAAPTVLAEVLAGQALSLAQAARRFPPYRAGRPVNPSTIWRWIRDGARLPDGRRLRLEAARVSGRWLTSEQALARFISTQTPDLSANTPLSVTPDAQRVSSARKAEKELERLGI